MIFAKVYELTCKAQIYIIGQLDSNYSTILRYAAFDLLNTNPDR